MNSAVKDTELEARIFSVTAPTFIQTALEIFRFQYDNNVVYNQFCQALHTDVKNVRSLEQIPFLPISFFKTHTVTSTDFTPQALFESSGTSQTINSKHLVKNAGLYEKSFSAGFNLFYGPPADWCILALLPSYLERNNSSLVVMADKLIAQTGHPESGFYLHGKEKLQNVLGKLATTQQKTLLIGVTFALLDLAEQMTALPENIIVMETGGMKGRRTEMPRQQVHEILSTAFNQKNIHSEYGMTELLSQAYSYGKGIFTTPPWMKILIREEDDPLTIHDASQQAIAGAINVIDLANMYSCSFIATDDAGKLHPDGSFEVIGRLDNSDIRGCSLLTL